MTRDAGTRLGPYEVVAPIGAGGMVEVWRARSYDIGHKNGRDDLVAFLTEMNTFLAGIDQAIEN